MSFEKPTTEAELTEYCLRRLGKPVIEINCATEQTAARIQDAIQFFNEYHFDGLERLVISHLVTSTDITNQYIDLTKGTNEIQKITEVAEVGGPWYYTLSFNSNPSTAPGITLSQSTASQVQTHILGISSFSAGDISVSGSTAAGFSVEFKGNWAGSDVGLLAQSAFTGLGIGSTVTQTTQGITAYDPSGTNIINITRLLQLQGGSNSLLHSRNQIRGAAFGGIGANGGLFGYDLAQRNLELSEDMINPEKSIRYSRTNNKLYIEMDWTQDVKVGDYLVFEAYKIIDPTVYSEVYNDMLLKRYCTALIKRQWGMNLKKFGGIQMVGGVELNGQQIFDEGNEEVQKIEEEIQLKWEEPPQFFVG